MLLFRARCFAAALLGIVCAAQDLATNEYRQKIQPFLAKNCTGCHSRAAQMANLNLEQATLPTATWAKVLDKMASGKMPPPGSPKPARDEIATVTRWIESTTGASVATTTAGPGRVTARRLNRAEYNNTVRDLLGTSLRPADEFPLDDAGYGFDNIGDVLSVSPLLMEKYLAAARKLSRLAVYGDTAPPRPTKLIRYMSKKSQDDPTPNALPYSYRGAIYGSFQFPVAGEYEFRMRVGNYRPREFTTPRHRELSRKRNLTDSEKQEFDEANRKAYPPVTMLMTVDGKQLLNTVVEGNVDFDYAHGETVGRQKLTAGEHHFRASFPAFAGLQNVRDNVNLDGRRKLFIDYVDIVGPFNPTAEPPESRTRIFVCEEKTPECARQIVETLTGRAYRRPASPKEIADLMNLARLVQDNGDSFDESIRVVLQTILVSPSFLFRVERDPAGHAEKGSYSVSPYELASRLSYFLWSTMPDGQLTRLAENGELQNPATLSAQVARMLKDAKSEALTVNFVGQWLGLRLLDRRKPSPAQFPVVDDELIDAMRRETELFAMAIAREDRSVLDFLDGRFSFLNGLLARHYEIPGVNGEDFRRVEFDGEQRGGVLSQASVLTLSSYATRTSPVLRGKWVLDNLLGLPPAPPPPNTPALQEANLGVDVSLRERLEQHRQNPSCAVCHDQMDPIGFGLENYDAAGAWRVREGKFPIDSSGKLPGGVAFHGPKQLKEVLKSQKDMFSRNLTEKMLTYALGRGIEPSDRETVNTIVERLAADNYRFSTLIQQVVMSQPFRMRETAAQPSGEKLVHR